MGWMGWAGLISVVLLLIFHKRLLGGPRCKVCGDDEETCLKRIHCPFCDCPMDVR
jgi:hypothetical protein